MAYSAKVFRILIASPSDVEEEREIAVRAIQEWNDLNSSERQIVLLPLRWETHTAPEFGARPQEIINKQVVDHCDLLVGIFWTRIGTPTGMADSGTIEEIERTAAEGKTVMLYFSNAKQDPACINLEQLAKLREFKAKTFPNALVESFSSPIEFRDKLSKQIEIQIRTLLAKQTGEALDPENLTSGPATQILFELANAENGETLGKEVSISTKHVILSDFDKVPDYQNEEIEIETEDAKSSVFAFEEDYDNKDYYREYLTYLVRKNLLTPVRFWLKNAGSIGARDVYIDISVKAPTPGIILYSKSALPKSPPPREHNAWNNSENHLRSPADIYATQSESWGYKIELRALQPQRVISPEIEFFIGATEPMDVLFNAVIYADTLSKPVESSIKMRLDVQTVNTSAVDLIESIKTRVRKKSGMTPLESSDPTES